MIILGKYKEFYNDDTLPSITEFIGKCSESDKKILLEYLEMGKCNAVAPAILKDVLSGERIKSELYCCSDGVYVWRSDLIYYVEKYDLGLERDFIEHCKKMWHNMNKHTSIIEKVNFLLQKAISKEYSNEELDLICLYSTLNSKNMGLGKVFGYSVAEYAFATLKWIGDEVTEEKFSMLTKNLSDDERKNIYELIEKNIYKQY